MLALLKLVNIQGWVGLGIAAILGMLLVLQKGETRHFKKQFERYELLYNQEKIAHQKTVINYQTAAEKARASDAANKKRVEALQENINEERSNSFAARVAAARLRASAGTATGNPGSATGAAVSGTSDPSTRPVTGTEEDGLLTPSDRLIATEQAIQLDELIKWVKQQLKIDVENNPE